MPKWEVKQPLDYSATGDDIDSASQKLIATLEDVYEKLNRLRTMDADALHSAADSMPFTWKIDTSIDPPAILIRNADDTDYIQVGSVTENMGITASDMGAITGDGMKKLSLGAEQDLPATAETYDLYLAYDTARVYIFRTGGWRKFLSLRFEDLLDVGDSVVEQEEVTTGDEPNKVPRLNEVGQGAFDITGSAAKIGGKNLFLPEIPDGSVLVFSATRDRWEVAKRDDITKDDVSTTGEPNKIVKADANGAIANDTKGNAAKIATKTIDVSNLQDGDVLVYDATYGTFKNKQGAVVNAQGVVEANVSGSAAKWGGKTIQTVNMVDGQILVWSESNQAFINRNQGTVGTGRALVISQDYEEKANYNGDNYRVVNIITPHLRVASQEYAVGTTCFSKNMPNTTYLECVTAGVTAATEPDMSSAAIGDVVADGGVEWKVCGYVNTEVTDALRTDVTAIETEIASDRRKPSTTYELKDIRYYNELPVGWYLECSTAGITDSGDITLPTPLVENATVTDGTCVWKVRKISSADGMPIGAIIAFGGNGAIPSGYLLCDGAAYSRTAFPDLFACIGTDYGSGDGSTTFNVPDANQAKRFLQGDVTAGQTKNAGLPNITGVSGVRFVGNNYKSPSGALKGWDTGNEASGIASGSSASTSTAGVQIDASLSNPIYGNSTTVQPDALTTRYIIKAFDGQTADSALIDITQYENELGRKVDKSDCPANGITNNSIYRGKDLTAYFESGQMSADMATGKWDNIFVGDYIIKSVTINGVTYADVKWIIMHINYHLHCGDTETTQNHVVLMPEEQLGTRQMNPTDTTAGGYVGSAMWTTHMPLVVAGIEAAFGADHVLAHRELLTNAMNGDLISANWTAARGATSGWAWVTVKANLATEEMAWGAPIWSSSAHDSSGDTMQLAAFKLNRGLICSKRYWWWLRSVANASDFCAATGDGGAYLPAASASGGGVRPYFLLH